MRVLSQAEIAGEEVWSDGLQALFRLAEAVATGMTAASGQGRAQRAELTALACVMMLERVNYLLSVGVSLPGEELAERLSVIIDGAFHLSQAARRDTRRGDASGPKTSPSP